MACRAKRPLPHDKRLRDGGEGIRRMRDAIEAIACAPVHDLIEPWYKQLGANLAVGGAVLVAGHIPVAHPADHRLLTVLDGETLHQPLAGIDGPIVVGVEVFFHDDDRAGFEVGDIEDQLALVIVGQG